MRNDIKISFEKPIYAIDEKNGVVVCTLRYKEITSSRYFGCWIKIV